MSDLDRYLTVSDGPLVVSKVRGSRFLARTFAVAGREEAAARLREIRGEYHAATHHVSAGRTAPPASAEGWCDDDGEPAGTAGAPVLARIEGRALYGLSVVVVRYFGGTKLGKGGLIRAYGDAATAALSSASVHAVVETVPLIVRCEYGDLGGLESFLARSGRESGIESAERAYGDVPAFKLEIRRSSLDAAREGLTDALAGRVRFESGDHDDAVDGTTEDRIGRGGEI